MKSKGIAPTSHAMEWLCKGYTRVNYLKASMEVTNDHHTTKNALSCSYSKLIGIHSALGAEGDGGEEDATQQGIVEEAEVCL